MVVRRAAVGVLVVVAWIALALAPVAVWARAQLMETDRWVAVAAPLGTEPVVQRAVADWATERLVGLVRSEGLARNEGRVQYQGLVRRAVLAFLRSDRFPTLWSEAVARAHEAALRVLEGRSRTVTAHADRVTIDLLPVLRGVLDRLAATEPERFARAVALADVPADLGLITVYDRGRVRAAQDALRRLGRLVALVVVVAVVAPLAAIALSTRRRRTALQLLGGVLVGAVAVRLAIELLLDEVLERIGAADARAVAARLGDRLVEPLVDGLVAIAVGAALVLVAALVLGAVRRPAPLTRGG